jgi:hypothetical protein
MRTSAMCRPGGDVTKLKQTAKETDLSEAERRYAVGAIERMQRFCDQPSLEMLCRRVPGGAGCSDSSRLMSNNDKLLSTLRGSAALRPMGP